MPRGRPAGCSAWPCLARWCPSRPRSSAGCGPACSSPGLPSWRARPWPAAAWPGDDAPARGLDPPVRGSRLRYRNPVNRRVPMSAGAIVAIIVAVVVVLLVIGAASVARRRKLQQRFGPEYDRVVGEMHSHRKAGAELAERERRVRGLDIHPLDETARAKYSGEWAAIQEQFVDQPQQ